MERMKDSFCNYGILGVLEPGPNFVQSVIFFPLVKICAFSQAKKMNFS